MATWNFMCRTGRLVHLAFWQSLTVPNICQLFSRTRHCFHFFLKTPCPHQYHDTRRITPALFTPSEQTDARKNISGVKQHGMNSAVITPIAATHRCCWTGKSWSKKIRNLLRDYNDSQLDRWRFAVSGVSRLRCTKADGVSFKFEKPLQNAYLCWFSSRPSAWASGFFTFGTRAVCRWWLKPRLWAELSWCKTLSRSDWLRPGFGPAHRSDSRFRCRWQGPDMVRWVRGDLTLNDTIRLRQRNRSLGIASTTFGLVVGGLIGKAG